MNTQEMQQEIEKILQEIEACSEKLDKAAKYFAFNKCRFEQIKPQ